MPCACKTPAPDFPTTCEWGPILWKILHGISEKYGKLVSKIYITDEQVLWPRFLQQTHKILPCEDCREHYQKFLNKNNPVILKSLSTEDAAIWVQNYFLTIHNTVNKYADKPEYTLDQVHELYETVNFQYEIKYFEVLLKRVFYYNEVSLLSWTNWVRTLRSMMSIYGL